MTAQRNDTIAAIATPPGMGGVGIVRVSGPDTPRIAQTILGRQPEVRRAIFMTFHAADGSAVDQGLAIYFAAPGSFTGEDVVEFHGHGGPVVMNELLQAVLAAGARLANPGEFTERAFHNGKLDLAQAEAVADLIAASSDAAARAALRSLAGEFSRRVSRIDAEIVATRVHIEATLDFPEDDIDAVRFAEFGRRLEVAKASIESLLHDSHQGQLLRDGMSVVLSGRPNAGKSSLLNCLAGRDAAIVSEHPGTTRDIVREQIDIDGLPLHFADTAGLRSARDSIEAEGVRRARQEISSADRILLVVDDQAEGEGEIKLLLAELSPSSPVTLVRNKIDLTGRAAGEIANGQFGIPEIWISASQNLGVNLVREHLKTCMGFQPAGEGTFTARRRHLDALRAARDDVDRAINEHQQRRPELLAECLRRAHRSLGQITGEFTTDDLLGEIFASFCIGK